MPIKKLQAQFYPRLEIADIMALDPKDKNFADKVRSRLNNWGYTYEYSRRGVLISTVPTTTEERLRELLIRKLNLDIQTDLKAYSLMFYLLATDYNFNSSPWLTRVKILQDEYGICIADSTMRNWTSRLIGNNIVAKNLAEPEIWKSYRDENQMKHQERVDISDEEAMAEFEKYNSMKLQYLAEADKMFQEVFDTTEHSPTRWKDTYNNLWKEFKCCYYTVKPFVFGVLFDEDYQEIFSLIEEIVQNLTVETEEKQSSGIKENKSGEFVF